MNHESVQDPQLTVAEILRLYISQWRLFTVLSVLLLAVSVLVYAAKVPFVSTGTLMVNDSQNSGLQAFSSQFYGLSKSVQESKKGNSLLAKHLEYLKTSDFLESLSKRIVERGQAGKISNEEKKGFQVLKKNYLPGKNDLDGKIRFQHQLANWMKVALDADFEVKISVATESREMSLFLVNTTLELSKDLLKSRELDELRQVEAFVVKQKESADKNLTLLNRQLAEYQTKDDNLLPFASKDKMGDYVSELLVRSNELKLKMAENSKMIDYLQGGRKATRESRLYGTGGQIEALELENKVLAGKLSQVQVSVGRLKQQMKKLPFATQMVEDLKKKSEIEFAKYKELSAALSKVEAQKLSLDSRFDILQRGRWDASGPMVGLTTLLLLALIASQVLGSVLIYFKFLWNPQEITASRDRIIFEGHSVDPRVIIENSKIKFKLRGFKSYEDEANELLERLNSADA